ncbi:MAG: hypothetical protein ACKO3T_03975 [Planctomycetaceae bacterium]
MVEWKRLCFSFPVNSRAPEVRSKFRFMAKRSAAAQESVNVSREVFAVVEGNQAIRGTEVLTVMREEFSNVMFNTDSVQVACANARRKPGLALIVARRPGKSKLLARRCSAAPSTAPVPTPLAVVWRSISSPTGTTATLQSARDFAESSCRRPDRRPAGAAACGVGAAELIVRTAIHDQMRYGLHGKPECCSR